MLEIKKRGKGKYNNDFGSKDCYDKYIESIDKKDLPLGSDYKNTSYFVSFNTYKKILKQMNKLVMNALINDNAEFTMPYRMGELSVKKRKVKIKLDSEGNVIKKAIPVDYKATKELWAKDPEAQKNHTKIYLFNEHFDGYKCLFYWKKKDINTRGIKPYCFRPTREYKRELAKQIKNNPNIDFYEL
jgi:hypothetical protein